MKGYAELESLFADWRAFEHPPLRDGAPDYGATAMARQHAALKDYQARLAAIDASGWPVALLTYGTVRDARGLTSRT